MNIYLTKIAEQSKRPRKVKYSHVKDSANATILIDHINKHYDTKPGSKKGKGKRGFAVGVGKDLAMHHLKKRLNPS